MVFQLTGIVNCQSIWPSDGRAICILYQTLRICTVHVGSSDVGIRIIVNCVKHVAENTMKTCVTVGKKIKEIKLDVGLEIFLQNSCVS